MNTTSSQQETKAPDVPRVTARQRTALLMLLEGPQTVRSIRERTNANNIPELIAQLRRKGISICMEQHAFETQDGTPGKYGTYSVGPQALEAIKRLLA